MLLFFGYVRLELSYNEYVTMLIMLGIVSGAHFFSCIIVFQFRRNLIEENRIRQRMAEREQQGKMDKSYKVDRPPFYTKLYVLSLLYIFPADSPRTRYAPRAPSPPPTYEEVSKDFKKLETKIEGDSESPPDYHLAVGTSKDSKATS